MSVKEVVNRTIMEMFHSVRMVLTSFPDGEFLISIIPLLHLSDSALRIWM